MDWRQQIAPVGPSSRSPALGEVGNALLDSVSRKFTLTLLAWKIMRPSGSSALPMLIGLLAMLAPATLALGDPGQSDGRTPVTPVPAPSPYTVVNHVGEPEHQISLLDGTLLVHRRTADPFGVLIRGPFKGLPPVAEHPVATPIPPSQPKQGNQPIQPVQVPVGTNEPTLEKAVQQLSIGGVNIAGREALIGSRSVHEGDLLVLELSGHQFVVWVQSIDRRGVQFCDVNLQRQTLRPFRFGPNELPGDSAGRQADVRDFLKQDVH
jgi:hypothetical protein